MTKYNGDGPSYYVGTLSEREVYWAPDKTHNPHLIICGSTGTGKTYTIKRIINEFRKQGVSFTVIDKHGDIEVELPEYQLKYGVEQGVNPLAVYPERDYGGPESNAIAFISLINELSGQHKLGPDQENMFFNTIVDLYRANGIYQEKPETWRKETYPDLGDLTRFLVHKYKKVLIGETDAKETDYLTSLHKEKKKLQDLEKEKMRGGEIDEKINEAIDGICQKYRTYLEKGILTDKDFLVYTNPKGLIGLKNRVQNINNKKIFIKHEVPLRNSRINIKFLEDEQKKIVAYYLMARLLREFLKRDYTDRVKHYLVIDECSFFLDVPKIANEITRIVQEGRKFGLGVILSAQNPMHFYTDILLNAATKMVLAVEPAVFKSVVKTFGIEERWLRLVVPRKNCLFSSKNISNGTYYIVTRG